MVIDLLYSVTLLLSLSLAYGFIIYSHHAGNVTKKLLSGFLFGGICVVGMILPIEISTGVIFDPRTVVLSIAGLFGGSIVAIAAALIAGAYRIFIGGGGVYVGLGVIIASAVIGLSYRYGVNKGWARINFSQLLLFGLTVHLVAVLFFTQLPVAVVKQVMATIAMPLLTIFTPATALLGLLLKNIEERIATELALKQSESMLSDHLHNTPLAAISWDKDSYVTRWNKAAEKIFGYTADEAIGRPSIDFIVSASQEKEKANVFTATSENTKGSDNSSDNITKDGRIINCEWYITPLLDSAGSMIEMASLCEDVTARKQSELMIWKQAHYDSLTGLANRQMVNNQLEQEIKIADCSSKSIALLFIDLDNFKAINDTFGRGIGDKLLIEAAKRLRSHIRKIDTVARLGGNEFVIIMGGLESPYQSDQVASNLLKKMAEPFDLGYDVAFISASIGITIYPHDASNSIGILKNGDRARYAAKRHGGNNFQYFTPIMQQCALSRLSLINDLRSALPKRQFRLHYQPIVNLMSGDIYKAEALIRWQHPTKGLISPIEFISIAEESGLIVDIGDWVFREASRQSARWRAGIHPHLQISINTSPLQYKSEASSAKAWLEYLQTLNIPGEAIAVEITERTLMESGTTIDETLLAFRDANIQVSLDDFGTGHSSLSTLKNLDIDYLKIDQLLVGKLAINSDDLALCEAIIVMAHKLGLKVIAEGVETEQQRELLLAAGCDYGQGYLFAKPLTAIEFEALLTSP
jgi:diguanylate cyclase (GGDEF)-like protein/PAS domain S-box-containing protein